tara:strand:+ start:118 stop:528 length:411 start_codon:yes stop_codon:yes gene_type:complete
MTPYFYNDIYRYLFKKPRTMKRAMASNPSNSKKRRTPSHVQFFGTLPPEVIDIINTKSYYMHRAEHKSKFTKVVRQMHRFNHINFKTCSCLRGGHGCFYKKTKEFVKLRNIIWKRLQYERITGCAYHGGRAYFIVL